MIFCVVVMSVTPFFGGHLDDYREMQENLEKLLPSIHAYIEQTWKPEQP